MMCQRIGFPPISIIGFGFKTLSSLIRVPRPPANNTAFIKPPGLAQLLLRSEFSPVAQAWNIIFN
jgi:hypothetical protein